MKTYSSVTLELHTKLVNMYLIVFYLLFFLRASYMIYAIETEGFGSKRFGWGLKSFLTVRLVALLTHGLEWRILLLERGSAAAAARRGWTDAIKRARAPPVSVVVARGRGAPKFYSLRDLPLAKYLYSYYEVPVLSAWIRRRSCACAVSLIHKSNVVGHCQFIARSFLALWKLVIRILTLTASFHLARRKLPVRAPTTVRAGHLQAQGGSVFELLGYKRLRDGIRTAAVTLVAGACFAPAEDLD